MWPYTEEENDYISVESKAPDWDYDTYGHGG